MERLNTDPGGKIRVLVNTWMNQQPSFLLLYSHLIFTTLPPPSSPPVCVFWFTGWGGRHSKHAHNTTHKHTQCTPPSIPHQASAVTKSIYPAQVTVSSLCNLYFRYSNFLSFKKKKKTWREKKGRAELCVSRNIHKQNHSLYELNMRECVCVCVFRRKLHLPWRTDRASTKSERCWLIVDTLSTHTHARKHTHNPTGFHLKSLRHRVTCSCHPGLIAVDANRSCVFLRCMEVWHNYRAQKKTQNRCSTPIRYISVSSSLLIKWESSYYAQNPGCFP